MEGEIEVLGVVPIHLRCMHVFYNHTDAAMVETSFRLWVSLKARLVVGNKI